MIKHIMNHYDFYGFREFIICLGYKQNIIKNYFFNFIQNDFCINTKDNVVEFLNKPKKNGKLI